MDILHRPEFQYAAGGLTELLYWADVFDGAEYPSRSFTGSQFAANSDADFRIHEQMCIADLSQSELLTGTSSVARVLGCWTCGGSSEHGSTNFLLKRLHPHGLMKKVVHGTKNYVTAFAKDILAAGLKLRELVIIPQPAEVRVA